MPLAQCHHCNLICPLVSPESYISFKHVIETSVGCAGGIPLGSQNVQVTASNCAGTVTCNAVVEVQDQEPLNVASGSCGNIPADGVLKTTLSQKLSDNVIASYTSTYAKRNGCPTSTVIGNLQCENCLLGDNFAKEVIYSYETNLI